MHKKEVSLMNQSIVAILKGYSIIPDSSCVISAM